MKASVASRDIAPHILNVTTRYWYVITITPRWLYPRERAIIPMD